jgi:uncharacterized membrane protein AbrB (regulator of aidB expression)
MNQLAGEGICLVIGTLAGLFGSRLKITGGVILGAMSALITLAAGSEANPAVVAAFHFFRVVFILLTTPAMFYLMRVWFPEVTVK